MLKKAFDWKPRCLYDLIQGLYELAQSQNTEIERALVGMGDFSLVPEMRGFRVSVDYWLALPDERRKQFSGRFHNTVVKPSNSIISTDKNTSIRVPHHKGKKKSQITRKRAHRTR